MKLNIAAPGLTPRAVLKSLAAIQLVDVHVPITDGRELVMPRYTEPESQQAMILEKLNLAASEATAAAHKKRRNHHAAGSFDMTL